jgi:transposase
VISIAYLNNLALHYLVCSIDSVLSRLSNEEPEILAYFDNRTTSGVVEGINNKLKLIKRSAYGFTNFENFRNRYLLNWYYSC